MSDIVTVHGEKLTKAENAILNRVAKGEHITDATQAVLHSKTRHAANQTANRILKRDRFLKVLKRAGLTDKRLAQKLNNLLDAQKPIVVDKNVELYNDNAVQLNTVKTLMKTQGYLNDTGDESENNEPLIIKAIKFEDNRSVTINNPGEK